jgi:uncharacterized protein (DUF305 family)
MRRWSSLALIVVMTLAALAASSAAAPAPKPSPQPSPKVTANAAVTTLSRLSGRSFDVAAARELLPRFEEDIEIAYAATLNADHPPLLQWNQKMIERKSGHIKRLLDVLKASEAAPSRRGVGVVTPEVKLMRGLKGGPLERRYLTLMIERFAHNAAVGDLAASKASQADLKAIGVEVAKIHRQEMAMLKKWYQEWYGK